MLIRIHCACIYVPKYVLRRKQESDKRDKQFWERVNGDDDDDEELDVDDDDDDDDDDDCGSGDDDYGWFH